MSALLNPSLVPDERLVAVAGSNVLALLDAMARHGCREYSIAQLREVLPELGATQLRGALHTGWAAGWVRPVQDDPASTRVDRWTLDDRVPHLAETYRVALIRRAEQLDNEFQQLVTAPQRLRVAGGR